MTDLLEAGTGIEPVCTDLQSRLYCPQINDLDGKKYQDKPGTPGEHDTAHFGVPTPESETPAALAGATGAKSNELAFKSKAYLKPRGNAMSLFAKDGHKRACRMLGYALTLNDPAMWGQTAAILSHRLTSMELAALAFAVMSALDPADREAVFDAAHWGVA